MTCHLTLILLITLFSISFGQQDHCVPEYHDQNSFACVCTAQDCRPIEEVCPVPKGFIYSWESSQARYRFHKTERSIKDLVWNSEVMEALGSRPIHVTVDNSDRRQVIHGFGGSFTDAAGINLASMSKNLSDAILRDYWSKTGLDYSAGRVPIGGTDFSPRMYTYDDDHPDDFELTHWRLQKEDFDFKIPFILKAIELKKGNINLVGSAWSPPSWMKTNGEIKGSGTIKGDPNGPYYKSWAKYHVKFLQAYAEKGINFWALTTGNEPTNALINEDFFFNSLGLKPESMRDFVKFDLGPALRDAGFGVDKLNLLMHDEVRRYIPLYTNTVLNDSEAAAFVTGIGYHWYNHDEHEYFDNLAQAHNEFPNHFLFSTEACEGWPRFSTRRAQIGNWTRAETYATDILKGLANWSTGWLDWNLVLNRKGGPSWAENWTDALIQVDPDQQKYYRNPMFYSLGHFSKWVQPGSVYLGSKIENGNENIMVAAFRDPSNQNVLVIMNKSNEPVELVIDGFAETSVPVKMAAHSLKTMVTPNELA